MSRAQNFVLLLSLAGNHESHALRLFTPRHGMDCFTATARTEMAVFAFIRTVTRTVTGAMTIIVVMAWKRKSFGLLLWLFPLVALARRFESAGGWKMRQRHNQARGNHHGDLRQNLG